MLWSGLERFVAATKRTERNGTARIAPLVWDGTGRDETKREETSEATRREALCSICARRANVNFDWASSEFNKGMAYGKYSQSKIRGPE